MRWVLNLAENGRLPEPVVRIGIRRLLRGRLAAMDATPASEQDLIRQMSESPIALATDTASAQPLDRRTLWGLPELLSLLHWALRLSQWSGVVRLSLPLGAAPGRGQQARNLSHHETTRSQPRRWRRSPNRTRPRRVRP